MMAEPDHAIAAPVLRRHMHGMNVYRRRWALFRATTVAKNAQITRCFEPPCIEFHAENGELNHIFASHTSSWVRYA